MLDEMIIMDYNLLAFDLELLRDGGIYIIILKVYQEIILYPQSLLLWYDNC